MQYDYNVYTLDGLDEWTAYADEAMDLLAANPGAGLTRYPVTDSGMIDTRVGEEIVPHPYTTTTKET